MVVWVWNRHLIKVTELEPVKEMLINGPLFEWKVIAWPTGSEKKES
jgi:hypothetical protein